MFTIYLITNRINGKSYVGKSTNDLSVRWARHVRETKKGKISRLYSSMRKHGTENFSITEVDRTDSLEQLNALERVWIGLMSSNDPTYGYNMTKGGDGGDTSRGLKRSPETIERMKATSGRRKNVSTEEIVRLYLSGAGSNTIAAKLGVGQTMVLSRLKKAGVKRRQGNGKIRKITPKKTLPPPVGINSPRYNHSAPTEEMIFLYEGGLSTRQIAARFGMEKTAIIGRLKTAGVKLRPNSREAKKAA